MNKRAEVFERLISEVGINYKVDFKRIEFIDLSEEMLVSLFSIDKITDRDIAEYFYCDELVVVLKRHKHNIALEYELSEEVKSFIENENRNELGLQALLNKDVLSISKAITGFVYRTGPIEYLHERGKITNDEMEMLNKFVYSRIYYLVNALNEKNWMDITCVLKSEFGRNINWDLPINIEDERNRGLDRLLNISR